jgi:uncharacterized repeat protein (TIGR01451 family)
VGASLAVFACALGAATASRAADTLQLTNQVYQEIEKSLPDGTIRKELVPAAKVIPGTEVLYVITYRNVGSEPAGDVVITNPVAKELAYRADSAAGLKTHVEVSVDGGGTFGILGSLKVSDGQGGVRPAQAGDVTHVRWKLAGAVEPQGEGEVSFRAVLR